MAPVTTVAERLRPDEVYQRFLTIRQQLGMEILPMGGSGGGVDVFGLLVRRLRKGGFVPLLADRDLTATGVPITLLARPRRMAAGAGLAGPGHRRRAAPGLDPLRAAPGGFAGPLGDRGALPPRGAAAGRWGACRAGGLDDAGVRRCARRRDRRSPPGLAHAAAGVRRRSGARRPRCPCVRIGLVCPYSFDVPGGVQYHVRDLAEHLIAAGHTVSVLAPADDDTPVPDYLEAAGRAVP